MKKITKKDLIFFIITIFIAVITYNKFISVHYSTDMYNIINKGYISYIISNALTDGRLFVGLYLLIGDLLNIKPEIYKVIMTIVAIIINSISVMKLKNIILKYKPTKNLYFEVITYIIAYCIIFNFIQVEFLYYIESASMSMAVLLIIFAANIFINKEKNYYLKAILLCILSVICYQATIPFFIALVLTISLIKNKNYKEVFKDIVKCGVIILLSVLMNVIIIKLITFILNTSQNRISFDISIIKENITYILNNILWIFKNQCNLYVEGMFPLLIGLLCILASYESLKQKENHILKILLIIGITILINFAMHIPTISSYYTGRTKYAVGAIIGLIFIYMYIRTEIFDKENLKSNFAVILLITYLSSNAIAAVTLTTEHKKVNELEIAEVLQIEEYIENYEKNNNIEIKNIGILTVYNEKEKGFFEEVENQSVLTDNAIKSKWSADGVINFYTGRKLIKLELTLEDELKYLSYIEGDNYYKCIEDTLYIKVYNY